jgi:prepilin-type N-terminal cleavage/methylation domain-containing protein
MNKRVRTAGFTLIETVVALTLLALSLAVLVPVFGEVIERSSRAAAQATAASLAASLTARLGTDLPLVEGKTSGAFGNGYGWDLEIAAYGGAEDRAAWPAVPFQVQATVTWSAGGRARAVTVTTLRLAPKDGPS